MTDEEIKDLVNNQIGQKYGFDPLTILTIISICIQLYKILKECKATKKLMQMAARRQGLAYRMFVKKHFIDEMTSRGFSEEDANAVLNELRLAFINS